MSTGRTFVDAVPERSGGEPSQNPNAENEQPIDLLKEQDERRVARAMMQLWESQSDLPEVSEREARWEVNRLRRLGYVNVRRIKDTDTNRWRTWRPRGLGPTVEGYNKARTLCRSSVGMLLADPPAPLCDPPEGSDADVNEVSTRALLDMQSPRRLNTVGKLTKAYDLACTYSSGFIVYRVDPTAGGRKPKKIMASPLAPDSSSPLVNPMTGMPWAPPPGMAQVALGMPPAEPPEPIERLLSAKPIREDVDPAGEKVPVHAFVETEAEAAFEWVPDIRSKVYSGKHVRMLPHGCRLEEACGFMVADFMPWGEVKRMAPELAQLPDEERRKLFGYRPKDAEGLLSKRQREVTKETDDTPVFTLLVVYAEGPDYEDGFYGMMVGGEKVLHRQPWAYEIQGERRALRLPAAQACWFENGTGDPYGDGPMDDLGGPNEIRYAMVGYAMAYLDRWVNMPAMVPVTSTLEDRDLTGGKMLVRVNPGGEAKGIKGPGLDPIVAQLFELTGAEMDSDSHLQQAAQGVEDPSVKSGRHAFQIVSQVHVQFSEPRSNAVNCYIRCAEVELELAQAFGLSGTARWTGEDGAYKTQKWESADLGRDVRLKPGTMTMLSPAAKAELIERYVMMQLMPPDEAREMLAQGIGALMGWQDNPFIMEVRRSIHQWEQGPPKGWMPQPPIPALPPGTPPEAVPPGMPVPMQPAPDPVGMAIFPPSPHHEVPFVAQVRAMELAKALARVKAQQAMPEWRALLEQEFMRAQGAVQMAQMAAQAAEAGPGNDKPNAPKNKGRGREDAGSPAAGMPPLDNPNAP